MIGTKKNILLCLPVGIALIIGHSCIGQNKPSSGSQVPAASGTTTPYKPSAYTPDALSNYVRTWSPQGPFTNQPTVISGRTSVEVPMSTLYTDGLGRPLQQVDWQASPTGKDIVAPKIYDGYGRESYQFLPYTSSQGNGNMKQDPFGDQASFYGSTYTAEQPTLQNEAYYYGHTNFEASPLNRPTKTFAPGNSWAGSEGGNSEKSNQVQYQTINNSDIVQIWNIDYTALTYNNNDATTNVPSSSTSYTVGTLYKTITIDEHGNAVVEYTDLQGQVVLKKVQVDNTIAGDYSGYTGFLCTYNVYDDFGLLRFVIPPKAVAQMITNGSWSLNSDIVNELCFRYEYDARKRPIAKKSPGEGWAYMVYDQMNRLVFSQDANLQRNSQWMGNFYDPLNRDVETVMMASYTSNTAVLQSYVNQNTGNYIIGNIGTGTQTVTGSGTSGIPANPSYSVRDVTVPLYQATQSITFTDGFSSEANASFVAQIVNGTASTFTNYVAVQNSVPLPPGATYIPLSVTNYDDYTATTKSYDNSNNSRLDAGSNPYSVTLPSTASNSLTNMVTSSKIRVIEDATDLTKGPWLETAVFYDDHGRTIQTMGDNYKGGVDVETQLYSFTGQELCTYEVHNNASGGITNFGIKTNMNYDPQGRLLNVTKQLNNNGTLIPSSPRTIATYTYDALGQLKRKQVGQNVQTGGALEDEVYNYNIHGSLKGVNWNYGASPSTSNTNIANNKWFAMDLSYDWGFGSNQYNGNISGQRWVNGSDGNERAYGYGYDRADRFMKADFTQNFGGNWTTTDPNAGNAPLNIDFSTKMGDGITPSLAYDENGNIKQMQHMGMVVSQSQLIDNLSYSYMKVSNGAESGSGTESNKLASVTDGAVQPTANLGDFNDKNTSGDDYGYDKAGNLISDLNKRIKGNVGLDQTGGGMTYTYLGKPWTVDIKNDDQTPKQTITYIYDAAGNKLEKKVSEYASSYNQNTAKQTTDDYLGGFVYENNVLQYFGIEEGRVRMSTTSGQPVFVYDFYVQDHLGNTRALLTEEQRLDVYPMATLEDNDGNSTLATQQAVYSIPSRDPLPPGYPTDNTGIISGQNTYTQKLNGNGTGAPMIGTGIILKVMAGDQINVLARCWYRTSGASPNSPASPLNSIIAALLSPVGGVGVASEGGLVTAQLTSGLLAPDVSSFLTSRDGNNVNNRPKAYLNMVVLDEQLRPVVTNDGNNSKFVQVPDESSFQNNQTGLLPITGQQVTKSGYVYVYVSNETPNIDVYFDNLQVSHTRGPLLEACDYYPYGLKIAGTHSKAAMVMANEYQYQAPYSEFEEETGYNEFDLRHYDAQIGRWTTTDPYGQFGSPYIGMGNNPINSVDEDGGFDGWVGALSGLVAGGTASYLIAKNNGAKGWGLFGETLGGGLLGAGIGYGIDRALTPYGVDGPTTHNFFQNFEAFYRGLVGDYDPVNNSLGLSGTSTGFAEPPHIWNFDWWKPDEITSLVNFQSWVSGGWIPIGSKDHLMARSISGLYSDKMEQDITDRIDTRVPGTATSTTTLQISKTTSIYGAFDKRTINIDGKDDNSLSYPNAKRIKIQIDQTIARPKVTSYGPDGSLSSVKYLPISAPSETKVEIKTKDKIKIKRFKIFGFIPTPFIRR